MHRVARWRARLESGYDALKPGSGLGIGDARLIGLLALALLLARGGFVLLNLHPEISPYSDENGYLLIAQDFTDWWSNGNAVRGPGYPAFLALLGSGDTAIQLGQVAFEVLGFVVLAWTVSSLWGRRPLLIFGALWILYAPFAYYDASILSESMVLASTAVIAALLVTIRRRGPEVRTSLVVGLGVAIGLQELIRPNSAKVMVLAAAVALVGVGSWKKGIVRWGIVVLAFLVTVSPWLLRNYDIYGRPLSATIGNYGLLVGVPPEEVLQASPVVGPAGGTAPLGQYYNYDFLPGVNNSLRESFYTHEDDDRNEVYGHVLWEFLTDHSAGWRGEMLQEHAARPFQLWGKSAIAPGEAPLYRTYWGDPVLLPAGRVLHLFIVAAALLSLVLIRSLRRDVLSWLVIFLIATVAAFVFLLPLGRYNLTMMPLVIAIASLGLSSLIELGRPRASRHAAGGHDPSPPPAPDRGSR